ncbi:MAG: TatD family hydrolase [Candidatus ainarchaeum sp.]|nr:TatD family hydrolase [Candidatus ainarchaeum sp.]
MIIDSHCHLDSFEILNIPKDIFPITSGYSHDSNVKNVEIGKKLKVPYTLGIAPQTSIREGLDVLDRWIDFIKSQSPVAIGEIGLDFHWTNEETKIKEEYFLFDKMITLAEEMNLPIVIHSRKAEKEVFEILKQKNIRNFVMHCYSGDYSLAEEITSFGGLISIPPIHSKNRKEVIEKIPLKYLIVESDAPYIVKNIAEVKKAIDYISDVKKLSFDEVVEKTSENTINFFKLEGFYV